MNLIKYKIHRWILSTILILSVLACKKEDDEVALDRMFRPTNIKTINGETKVDISWNASVFTTEGNASYLIEVSQDSAGFGQVIYADTIQETGLVLSDLIIPIKQNFYARVKALGSNGAEDSKWETSGPFKIIGEQFLLAVPTADVIDKSVILHWKVASDLTKIILTPAGGGTPIEVILTPTESQAGVKQVDGLNANTTYTAEIFKGDISKGTVTFKTKPAITGSNIIHLEGISSPTILEDTLKKGTTVFPCTILLKRGYTYTFSAAYSFGKSVTIMSAYEVGVPDKAKIEIFSQFNAVANSTIDSLVFKDVHLYTKDYTARYVFNINTITTINKMVFDNCKVEFVRGMARVQTSGAGAKVTDLVINNCVIDSVRDFGVVGQSGTSSFKNIVIQNSTIYKAQKLIVSSTSVIQAGSSVSVQNCTFNDVPTIGNTASASNYFIDFGATLSVPITITNCIFGKTVGGTSNSVVYGIRDGASPNINITGFNTKDCALPTLATAPTNYYPISGPALYNVNSTDLWNNPSKGDFSFKDLNFSGISTAGDPRWRK